MFSLVEKSLGSLTDKSILSGLLIFSLTILGISFVFRDDGWLSGILQNVSTELLGALIIYTLIEKVIAFRQEKQRVIRDLASSVTDVSMRAFEEMKALQWFEDGTLHQANLAYANLSARDFWHTSADFTRATLVHANFAKSKLSGVRFIDSILMWSDFTLSNANGVSFRHSSLGGANFRAAQLLRADFHGADMSLTNCTDADFTYSDLSYVELNAANLARADLTGVKLVGANLSSGVGKFGATALLSRRISPPNFEGAKLVGANLTNANLTGCDLRNAVFDSTTTLPDGKQFKSYEDLERFTNPNHEEYFTKWHKLSSFYSTHDGRNMYFE